MIPSPEDVRDDIYSICQDPRSKARWLSSTPPNLLTPFQQNILFDALSDLHQIEIPQEARRRLGTHSEAVRFVRRACFPSDEGIRNEIICVMQECRDEPEHLHADLTAREITEFLDPSMQSRVVLAMMLEERFETPLRPEHIASAHSLDGLISVVRARLEWLMENPIEEMK